MTTQTRPPSLRTANSPDAADAQDGCSAGDGKQQRQLVKGVGLQLIYLSSIFASFWSTGFSRFCGLQRGQNAAAAVPSGSVDSAKSLLKVSEQRNVMLAQLIRGGAGGYGGAGSRMGGGMSPMMGSGMGGMSPMSLGAGGMPGIPNLSSLSALLGDGRRGRDRPARPGLNLHPPVPTGPGADAFRTAIRHGLTIKGVTDPVARANWEAGMMVVGDRESDFNNTAVNGEDRNATEGNHSAGTLQFTRTTFEEYHEPGTSADRSDNVAQSVRLRQLRDERRG